MNIGFYAGSFDPFTNGHLHVVKSSAELFDKIIIGIGIQPNKIPRFNKELMKNAIERVLIREGITNATVITYDNLSVDTAMNYGANVLIRGIRNGMDYEYEENLASINEELSGLNTIYIRSGNLGNISSSMVMELLQHHKDVSKYLPQEILEIVNKK